MQLPHSRRLMTVVWVGGPLKGLAPQVTAQFARIVLALLALAGTVAAQNVETIVIAPTDDLSTKMAGALRRLPNGGVIQFQPGEYVVRSQLDPAGVDHITVQGIGPRTVIRFANGYFGPDDRWIFNMKEEHNHWTFREFTFDGNDGFAPKVCDRDKIIKLRGNHVTIERLTVQNEAGRGFATILGDDQRWLNCNFNDIGTRAGDSSVVHPGNKFRHAQRVLVSGCMGNLGRNKVTFIDAVGGNMVFTKNIIQGGKTGVILSWWKSPPSNVVISSNVLLSTGRACRLNRKKKTGDFQRVVITNNVMTGPLDNQFGRGFVASGNTLKSKPPPK